jgi:hypothetical protein
MMSMRLPGYLLILGTLPLVVTACNRQPAGNNVAAPAAANAAAGNNAAAPANAAQPVASAGRAFTADGELTGLEAGDHLWATFNLPGHEAESTTLVESGPLAAFLNEHRGRRFTVQIETVNRLLDPPGEMMDVTILRSARIGNLASDAWWAGLSADAQAAARRGAENLMSAPAQ